MAKSLTELFIEQLRLCRVDGTQTVAVISEHGKKTEYVDACVAAARALDAGVVVLTASSMSHPALPPYEADGRGVSALLAAAGECDMVVDVTVGGLIHSDVRTRITGNGKRMLFVAEPANVLERLTGTPALRDAVDAAAGRLQAGSTMEVTSSAGTQIAFDISGSGLPITRQWGFVDEPGRWDHWPSGFIACFPRDRSAAGVIVLQPGDVLLPWQRYVRDIVSLEVSDGYITRIDGHGADAFALRDYFARWEDPEVYAISHVGWGLHPVASWAALEVYDPRTLYGQELRSTAGNFMWSTGSNRFANRDTPAHLDIPMHGCTVEIDGVAVVENGKLVDLTRADMDIVS
ncbi:2,5-dihydroxypyridine 5,6-dioxygenase [Burkholderia aenigmatica]|uniref:2,5-dihydroxypyridine 5,6-dioxygenase n=1 Tax=Burkholderia cepacia complex TaxID=87882 RepID=UPI001C22BB22|nr:MULTISPECIES: 2,5-dihydroxypyridine 5,6-dioxygenase [Burkholderia cepacia complex]MBU9445222.1 2,5-dihydroxypyridine 5,6-dioxygenase [Burkholderia multivorans]MCA8222106.1 2,5-dihydroxypyridine 5,6-dioxygenase [Burkholderia multivorans]UKD17558.1 2,5-dihydroxypyridine 5,6-dioxygenase [Burkholderia aenigmatica]